MNTQYKFKGAIYDIAPKLDVEGEPCAGCRFFDLYACPAHGYCEDGIMTKI